MTPLTQSELTVDQRQCHKHALLQAAAVIYSGSLIKAFDRDQHPVPHYWENYESAVDAAMALLAEIERREP